MALAVIVDGTVSASLHKHFIRNSQTQFFKYKCICNLLRRQERQNFPMLVAVLQLLGCVCLGLLHHVRTNICCRIKEMQLMVPKELAGWAVCVPQA
uniref:Uncharacterized protein n=1 Tax=Pyxicephalus adspersus TaxID=30357 RepID=A0AAV3ACV5_PYXAD|nr:TPA: hypothetical protein GDO54_011333 [Pyxicephalus adspersus]